MDFDGKAISSALLEYTGDVAARAMRTDFDLLAQIARTLIEAKERGATIYTAGNGGSAATASHICNDLLKGCRVHNREGFKTECLADSCAVMTCLGNDFSYEEIFSIQLRTKAHRGDVLLVYSGSGNSPNIVRLVDTAREMGVVTIGFSGRDGGKLAGRCDLLLIAPTDSMEQIEDLHMLYVHALSSVIQQVLPDRWGVEYVRYPDPKAGITTALFDFDGTVSLIREGWREIMVPYLPRCSARPGPGNRPRRFARWPPTLSTRSPASRRSSSASGWTRRSRSGAAPTGTRWNTRRSTCGGWASTSGTGARGWKTGRSTRPGCSCRA